MSDSLTPSSNGLTPDGPASGHERLGVSVAWSYAFAVLLMLFIFLIVVPDPDGPSPWDTDEFQARMLDLFANFRILDELADLGIVKVADVGEGLLDVKLDLMVVSGRHFGWAPLYLAVVFVSVALLLRGIRQRFLASHLGVLPSVRGQVSKTLGHLPRHSTMTKPIRVKPLRRRESRKEIVAPLRGPSPNTWNIAIETIS